MFENRVLRIYELKREEVTGRYSNLLNEEFHGLYDLRNIISMIKSKCMRWAEHVARIKTKTLIGLYNVSREKPQGKGPLGSPRCRWKDNTQTDLKGLGREGVDGIQLA
jgi:hypothetical protein